MFGSLKGSLLRELCGRSSTVFVVAMVAVMAFASTTWAKSTQTPHEDTTDETVTSELRKISDTITVSGALVPKNPEEVKYEPKTYSGKLEVVEARNEGPVKAGDVLMRFDTEDIDTAIEKAERAAKLSKIKLQQAEIDLAHAKASADRDFHWTERNHRIYKDNYDRYMDVERAMREESEELSFQWNVDYLKDQKEEFEQLEKMYKSDDLTEETEDIVLRRTARDLTRSLRYHEFSKVRHEHWKKTYMERELARRRHELAKAEAKMDKTRKTWRFAIEKQELSIMDVREGHDETLEKLDELRHDLVAMMVKAPISGLAVPAAFSGTKWSGLVDRADRYRAEDKVKADTTLYTILPSMHVRVRCVVKDKDIAGIETGTKAYIKRTSTSKGDDMIVGKISYVAPLPADGKYPVWVDLPQEIDGFRPGQETKVELRTSEVREAVCVPKDCLRKKDKKHFVYGVDGKSIEVETGASMNGFVEIKKGLKADATLRAEPPEEKKKDKAEKKKDDEEKPKKDAKKDSDEASSKKAK